MDDPRWLRLMTVGLILAALAVGYFFIAGKFTAKNSKPQPQVSGVTQKTTSPTPTAAGSVAVSPSPTIAPSAYNAIVQRTKGDIQELPATGIPTGFIGVFASGAVAIGWGLRKFPH